MQSLYHGYISIGELSISSTNYQGGFPSYKHKSTATQNRRRKQCFQISNPSMYHQRKF